MKDLPDIAALVILYLFIFYPKWRARRKDALVVNTLMYIYLSFVLYFTLMPIITALPFIMNHAYVPMNLTPFIDVTLSRGDYIEQVLLNIIMTVPFGFLFPLTRQVNAATAAKKIAAQPAAHDAPAAEQSSVRPRHLFSKTLLATFLLSLGIELIQPLLSNLRSSDITDIITNVTGGIIGYFIYLVLRPVTDKILEQLKPKQPENTN